MNELQLLSRQRQLYRDIQSQLQGEHFERQSAAAEGEPPGNLHRICLSLREQAVQCETGRAESGVSPRRYDYEHCRCI